ncbi:MAG: ATP-dependent DNA helicase [Saprospiraceae bacterium]
MTFEEKFNKLNDAQKQAVQAIDGPVMVIAGPGTGKTEILSLRIGQILKTTDTPPGSILCLTYTDAASSEMRHRLIDFIGPEAYSIQVNTFHSFCNLVIQENPSVFQQARDLEPISEIDKFRLIQKLMDTFDDDHPLKKFKGQTYSSWDRLLGLFSTMKRENWSPDYMTLQIEEYISRMAMDDNYIYKRKTGDHVKGDFNAGKFKKEVTDRMNPTLAAVNAYDQYNALLAQEGKYDYDDMLLWVYDAFDKDPDLVANYQERFLYFLVDEFQDTNGIQISILQKLIDHEYMEQPNVFVVGDDDQAIYRFQGANIQNMVEFKERYVPRVIILDHNYRSSQKILDAARHIMMPVENSLMKKIFGATKILKADGVYKDYPQHVGIHDYSTASFENADIFHKLKRWYQNKIEGSIAVLYTKHDLGADLGFALRGAAIPFQTSRSSNALSQPVVIHLLDILSCLQMLTDSANNDDALLYRILHLRYLEPRATDLQRLILAYTAKDRTDHSTLFMWLGNSDIFATLGLKNREWMQEKFSILEEGISNFHSITLIALVEWIVYRFGIMKWILQQPEKFVHLYSLKSFYTFVESESSGKISFRTADLIDICDVMRDYNIRLPVQELASNPTGINLSTLHGAKGLEYDTVVIKNFVENEWEKKRAFNRNFSFPDNLVLRENITSSTDGVGASDIEDQDRRRLVYVGMTRAKKDLILSYANKRDDGKILTPSKYLTEIARGESSIVLTQVPTDEELLADYLVARMSGQQQVDLHKDNQEIRNRVANFVLNVSALNQYLECPLKFFYDKILLIPSAEKSYFIFGSALHDALQKLMERKFNQHDATAGKEYLLWAFDMFMNRNKHKFTKKEFTDQATYGKKVLGQYYDLYATRWSTDVKYATEYRIRDVHIEGVPVTGFIDRLDIRNDDIRVYDYKTGRADKFYQKLKRPTDEAIGGSYWRQMVFYDLLLKKDPRIHKHMSAGIIQALEPDKDGKFIEREIHITDEDREHVTKEIQDTYQKIQNMEFEKFCGECEWCKMHDLTIPLLEEDEAELEN